jgi:transmembrane sensor
MSNSHDPNDAPTEGATAAWWLASARAGALSAEAEVRFRAWLSEPGNRLAYARAERAWAMSGRLADSPAIDRLRASYASRRRPRRAGPRLRRLAVAGAAFAASAAAAAFVVLASPSLRLDPPVAVRDWLEPGQLVRTPPGAPTSLALSDGTRVTLDGRSELRVRFSGKAREVSLERGRAYFDVAHDKSRPFTVAAAGGEIRDIGTRFVVDNDAGQVRVSLIEGRVEVTGRDAAREAPLALRPGQEAEYRDRAASVAVRTAAVDPLAWTRGQISFNDTPLQEAARRLSRYTPETIEVPDELSDRAVTGVFNLDNRQHFAEALAAALGLKAIHREGGAVRLSE